MAFSKRLVFTEELKMFYLSRAVTVLAMLSAILLGQVAQGSWTTVRHESMGWTFATAVSQGQVVGFLGWESDGQAALGNIKVMWFEREQSGHWTSWAWPNNDLGVAVNSVRTLLGDPSVFSRDIYLANAAQSSVELGLGAPDPVIKGLYADDALQSVIATSTNPEQLVEFLADAGWPVGKTLSAELAKADTNCEGVLKTPINAMMDHFAHDSELALFGASTIADPCADWLCVGCVERQTSTPGVWGIVHSTPRSVGGYKCEWRRTITTTTTSSGRTYWGCNGCIAPAATTVNEDKTTYSVPGEDCTGPSADPEG